MYRTYDFRDLKRENESIGKRLEKKYEIIYYNNQLDIKLKKLRKIIL